jgi:hypothetical protein
MSRVKPFNSLSEVADILVHTEEIYTRFSKRKRRGRPPKLGREHIKALLRIIRTLVDDIDECMDKLLPDTGQVESLLNAIDYLVIIKKRYTKRLQKIDEIPIPADEVTYEE